MRIVNFRAWDEIGKRMLNKVAVYHEADHIGFACMNYDQRDELGLQSNVEFGDNWVYVMSDFVLMQFTGLNDFFGNKIFEGDIVQFYEPGEEDDPNDKDWNHSRPYRVEWYETMFCLYPYEDGPGFVPTLTFHMELEGDCDRRLRVIGNIYEHPELMEIEHAHSNSG